MERERPFPMEHAKEEQMMVFAGVGEIREEFFRSGGKGGQNVNKVETGVRLRAEIVDGELLARLKERFPGFVTDRGELIVEVTRERTQGANRRIAYEKLAERLARARESRAERIPTEPSRAAKERRLSRKRERSAIKELRKPIREW